MSRQIKEFTIMKTLEITKLAVGYLLVLTGALGIMLGVAGLLDFYMGNDGNSFIQSFLAIVVGYMALVFFDKLNG